MSTQPKRNGADDSVEPPAAAVLGFIPDTDQPMSLPKILGIVISILVILGIVVGFGKASLDTHKEGVHDKALSKDVYEQHVKLADERHTESKEQRKEILGKLDTLLVRMPAPAKD